MATLSAGSCFESQATTRFKPSEPKINNEASRLYIRGRSITYTGAVARQPYLVSSSGRLSGWSAPSFADFFRPPPFFRVGGNSVGLLHLCRAVAPGTSGESDLGGDDRQKHHHCLGFDGPWRADRLCRAVGSCPGEHIQPVRRRLIGFRHRQRSRDGLWVQPRVSNGVR